MSYITTEATARTRIHRGGVQREAAESADPDNADPFLIDDREDTERVNRGAEVFGIHVRDAILRGRPLLSPVQEGSKASVTKPRDAISCA